MAVSLASMKCFGARVCSEEIWCLDHHEGLGEGQLAEIDRVYAAYPELNDDQFVAENRERWLLG